MDSLDTKASSSDAPTASIGARMLFGSISIDLNAAASPAILPRRFRPPPAPRARMEPDLACPEPTFDLNSPPPDLSTPVGSLAVRMRLHPIKAIHELDEAAARTAAHLSLSVPSPSRARRAFVAGPNYNKAPTFAPLHRPPTQPFIVDPP